MDFMIEHELREIYKLTQVKTDQRPMPQSAVEISKTLLADIGYRATSYKKYDKAVNRLARALTDHAREVRRQEREQCRTYARDAVKYSFDEAERQDNLLDLNDFLVTLDDAFAALLDEEEPTHG